MPVASTIATRAVAHCQRGNAWAGSRIPRRQRQKCSWRLCPLAARLRPHEEPRLCGCCPAVGVVRCTPVPDAQGRLVRHWRFPPDGEVTFVGGHGMGNGLPFSTQNDQRIAGVVLRHKCWGTLAPPHTPVTRQYVAAFVVEAWLRVVTCCAAAALRSCLHWRFWIANSFVQMRSSEIGLTTGEPLPFQVSSNFCQLCCIICSTGSERVPARQPRVQEGGGGQEMAFVPRPPRRSNFFAPTGGWIVRLGAKNNVCLSPGISLERRHSTGPGYFCGNTFHWCPGPLRSRVG